MKSIWRIIRVFLSEGGEARRKFHVVGHVIGGREGKITASLPPSKVDQTEGWALCTIDLH